MKHSEWLRLQSDSEALASLRASGDRVVASLRADGFNCRFPTTKNYPWTLVRLLPNAQHYTVGRFYSRTEAENHKRFLGKWMPAAEFEVVFDAEAVT
jgi:hypothetical protein